MGLPLLSSSSLCCVLCSWGTCSIVAATLTSAIGSAVATVMAAVSSGAVPRAGYLSCHNDRAACIGATTSRCQVRLLASDGYCPEGGDSPGVSYSLKHLKETLSVDKLETALCHRKKIL